jgi:ethanolamine permease
LNIYGVRAAATFELIITVLAVGELLLFSGLTLPHFQWSNVAHNAFPNGWAGVFASIPFAIWFFLGIVGVANVAEETIDPQRTVAKGFGSAIITLIVLCVLVFLGSVGVAGWEAVVFAKDGAISDSPLPLALGHIVGNNNFLYHLLITVGLFGLVASFHGLMLASGRSTFEFGRVGFAPSFLGRIHLKFKTPANALVVNMLIGIFALLTGRTGDIITISVFGALTLYAISMLALIKLRKMEPQLPRPYKVPLFPITPIIAFSIAIVSLIALAVFNQRLCLLYLLIVGICYGIFKLWNLRKPQE